MPGTEDPLAERDRKFAAEIARNVAAKLNPEFAKLVAAIEAVREGVAAMREPIDPTGRKR